MHPARPDTWRVRRYSPEEIEKEVAQMREEMEKEGAEVAAKPDNKYAAAFKRCYL